MGIVCICVPAVIMERDLDFNGVFLCVCGVGVGVCVCVCVGGGRALTSRQRHIKVDVNS